jgi:hypothetical protein
MASALLSGSGGWTRPSWRSGPGNQRPPGYEPSSCRGGLRPQFHAFEGAPSGSARVSLARFAAESKCEDTSLPVSRLG